MDEPQLPGDGPAAAPAVPPPPGRSGQRREPRITVPNQLMVDEPGGVVISGCMPGQGVTVTAFSQIDGLVHEAVAVFTADGTGQVDTARHASTAGSYTGTDAFGLWWSATPAGPAARAATPAAPVACRLTAQSAGRRSPPSLRGTGWLPAPPLPRCARPASADCSPARPGRARSLAWSPSAAPTEA